jgi:large subunit ribosomal protein L17
MPGTRKLGKPTDQRMAMLRQQVTDLLTYGKLTTTVTRAKEVRPLAEKMITLGKANTLASRRQALAFMTKEDAVTRVFTILAPIYAERNGGYTRIVRLGARRGDGAEEAIIALVDEDKIAAADAEAEKARKEEERAAKKTKKTE